MLKNKVKQIFATVTAFAVIITCLPHISAETESKGFTTFRTSYDPEFYAEVEIEGDVFNISGIYARDHVVEVTLNRGEDENKFTPNEDGSFTAQLTYHTDSNFDTNLFFILESGVQMPYMVRHDENGWYFPDAGLVEPNAEKLEKIQTAAPEASAYYISQTADPEEVKSTMEELQRLVEEICGDETDVYRKAYLLDHWISSNISYDHDAANTGVTLDTIAIHNVLERRRTTCAGFANTFCAMLELIGVRSVNLKGAAVGGEVTYDTLTTAGENHEFSAFWYEKENRWVYVDPGWGSNSDYINGEYTIRLACDKYFDITGEAFALNHRVDKAEERNYTGAYEALTKTEETTTEPEETEKEPAESSASQTQQSAEPTSRSETTSEPQPSGGNDVVIYIVIGAAGVILIVIGIIIATRKKR